MPLVRIFIKAVGHHEISAVADPDRQLNVYMLDRYISLPTDGHKRLVKQVAHIVPCIELALDVERHIDVKVHANYAEYIRVCSEHIALMERANLRLRQELLERKPEAND